MAHFLRGMAKIGRSHLILALVLGIQGGFFGVLFCGFLLFFGELICGVQLGIYHCLFLFGETALAIKK